MPDVAADERRSLEAELEPAQRVQQALVPQAAPAISGVAVAAFSRYQLEEFTQGQTLADDTTIVALKVDR